jgi:hypothetical protein
MCWVVVPNDVLHRSEQQHGGPHDERTARSEVALDEPYPPTGSDEPAFRLEGRRSREWPDHLHRELRRSIAATASVAFVLEEGGDERRDRPAVQELFAPWTVTERSRDEPAVGHLEQSLVRVLNHVRSAAVG